MGYIDVKESIWKRYYFSDNANLERIVEDLKINIGEPYDIICSKEAGYEYCEDLDETDAYITPEENQAPTIEVYNGEHECIWQNMENY